MAKRRRLLPLGSLPDSPADLADPDDLAVALPAFRAAPIADMAGAAAATAALQEMADSLTQARDSGRMVLALPLDQIEAGYLVRDRIATDPEEMAALTESLRARGQQTPIEVVALGPARYGLISGWRRLKALRQLAADTGEPRFATVLALLRRPDQSSDAYVAMVEENEIRVGLSFYERARIVAKAVEAGAFADDRAALRGLFAAASRAKRSKVGSFLAVVRALDGHLRFPEAIGERLGLTLAQMLDHDPAAAARLQAALSAGEPATAADEQALLARAAAALSRGGSPAERAGPGQAGAAPGASTGASSGASSGAGLQIRLERPGRLVIEGAAVDEALLQRLAGWLRDFAG